jgi:16S rRNA processing protein RimM
VQLAVGTIGKAHGIRGDVAVLVRSDNPDRFAPGAQVTAADGRILVVDSARWHSGRLLVHFEGIDDRTAAEALRGLDLVADSDTSGDLDDDEYWDHDLIGCRALTDDGRDLGEISDVVHPPGAPLLVVTDDNGEHLVPFVTAVVPRVDLQRRRVIIAPPPGLWEL